MDIMRKLSEEEYNNLFVTSDLHFNHVQPFVWEKRGYKNPQEMTDHMIEVINDQVGPRGTLLFLGDLCLNTTMDQLRDILARLKIGKMWMLWGNHNNPLQKNLARGTTSAYYGNTLVEFLGHYFTFRFKNRMYSCSHFPFLVWDGMRDGAMHLCGHSHGDLPLTRPEHPVNKILDCGWDIYKRPLTMKDIETIMDSKQLQSLHH
jgi:calcineurin-like phosphoesterase family protein